VTKAKFKAVIFVLLLSISSVYAARALITSQNAVPRLDKRNEARVKGTPNAPLWIVEYSDFQCDNCRQAYFVMKEYLEKYPSQIFLQVRFYPITRQHLYALKAAIYAECAAGQKKFWEFHDILFEKQDEWAVSQDPDSLFLGYALKVGIDPKVLEACVNDPKIKGKVEEEKIAGRDIGVDATPTFFIGGKMITGAKALREELEAYFSPEKEPRGR